MGLRELIAVARGQREATLLLKNVQLVNVLSGEILPTNVAIYQDLVAGVGPDYQEAEQIIDLKGKLLLPGLIDGHVHIESSMVTIPEYARTVVPNGTTAIVIDPHEIANVRGLDGVSFMMSSSKSVPLGVYVMVPSCVPASPYETAGDTLLAYDLADFLLKRRVLGMGEIMNFPGILNADEDLLGKLAMAHDMIIDGHAPGLTGKDLNAYIISGIMSDHECVNPLEALEKLRLGMWVMVREGSTARNLNDLIPALSWQNHGRCLFVTDDRHPSDLVEEGHINSIVKKAISLGLDPMIAVRMATINPARYFRLNKLGAIAPGFQADMVVIDNFNDFNVEYTLQRGRIVAQNGEPLFGAKKADTSRVVNTVSVGAIPPEKWQVRAEGNEAKARVIGVVPGQAWSHKLEATLPVVDGLVQPDPEQDIAKIAVVERHRATGNVGVGFVKGFGLKRGAIASTVAHDAHNLVIVGCNDADMQLAVDRIVEQQGGLVAVRDGKVLETLPLPIAGLMTEDSVPYVAKKLEDVQRVAHQQLGVSVDHPFMTMAFLALSVIPELKITDKGLVDVEAFELVPAVH
ncbi:MAG: adenine deaminase [Bacteroidota bacterium]